MLGYLLLGATFAFAAVAQPGPFQAWLMAQTVSRGWRRTLPAAFSPLLSDGPVILVTMLALSRLPGWFTTWMRAAGGVFLLYLAAGAFQAWRSFNARAPLTPAAGGSLMRATLVNLLNPNPWMSWSLVLGPLLLKAWREAPSHAAALLAGFYGLMVLGLAALILLFGLAGKLGPGVSRALTGLSALALTFFGCWLLWAPILATWRLR